MDGVGPNGYLSDERVENPIEISLSGVADANGGGWAPDITSSTDDNCVCMATEVTHIDPTLDTIDFICFIFFSFEVVVRFLAYKSKHKWASVLLNWIDVLALLPSIIKLSLDEADGLPSDTVRNADSF